MDYPLLINGQERGKLKLEKQGLYTLMEAGAPGAEGMVRLWVQGGGEEAYLGVMEPRDTGLYLRRKLSRLEMSAFPQNIERASDRKMEAEKLCAISGQSGDMAENEPEKPPVQKRDQELKQPKKQREASEEKPPAAEEPREGTEAEKKDSEPKAEDIESNEEAFTGEEADILWTARRDGSLIARRGERYLVALPARLRSVPPGARLRRIGDREYLLFVY